MSGARCDTPVRLGPTMSGDEYSPPASAGYRSGVAGASGRGGRESKSPIRVSRRGGPFGGVSNRLFRLIGDGLGSRDDARNRQNTKDGTKARCEEDKNVVRTHWGSVEIECEGCRFSSDLRDPECRGRVLEIARKWEASRIILKSGYAKREYGESDLKRIMEAYKAASELYVAFPRECGLCAEEHKKQIAEIREELIRDPARVLRLGVEVGESEDIVVRGVERERCAECRNRAEGRVLEVLERLEKLGMGREDLGLSPVVIPFFADARILQMERGKKRGSKEGVDEIVEEYTIEGARVIITRGEEDKYYIFPPEYELEGRQLRAMRYAYDQARKGLRKGSAEEYKRLVLSYGEEFAPEEVEKMSKILTRYTAGLGILELLLKDPNLQDVYVNSPISSTPVYVKHRKLDDCRTNIYLSEKAARGIISKFRLRSGRPFSEVSPILDMELPEFGVRVNITGPPVSPDGIAFAFRRASEEPWTLLRFVENRMISPLAGGLLWMLVNEESSLLLCGDRGSGKTSMLTALVGAMPIKYRILTIEDTFEIPVPALAKNGFRIQRMRIRPSTASDSFEIEAEDAMRSLLRMGDSAIVMGEVRGREARTLYEAMNVGGSGNCVLGTIHGKSPRGLLERVVFSLGVPPQSFKATDVVVITDRIRPKGGSTRIRRVTEIVEVGKGWKEPRAEEVFANLMRYDRGEDKLVEGERMLNPGESEILQKVATRRGIPVESVLEDIKARGRILEGIVQVSRETGNEKLLSVDNMVALNQMYTKLVDAGIKEGKLHYNKIAEEVVKSRIAGSNREPFPDLSTRGHVLRSPGV